MSPREAKGTEISVVIPVDGRHEYLDRSLETILRQRSLQATLRAEIIVVDNARSPAGRQATRQVCGEAVLRHRQVHATLRYVATRHGNPRHRNVGYPRNVGIRLATAPVVLMSDADILHVTETLAQHVRRHGECDDLLLYSFCRDCDPGIALSRPGLETALQDESQVLRMAACTDWFGGGCCSARRARLAGVGGFEESFTGWGYEDYDLARRLRRSGIRIIRDDEIKVLHQTHPRHTHGAWLMKARAGLRQILGVGSANRNRAWGRLSGEPELIAGNTRVAGACARGSRAGSGCPV